MGRYIVRFGDGVAAMTFAALRSLKLVQYIVEEDDRIVVYHKPFDLDVLESEIQRLRERAL